jgi:hypothetical protein
VLKARCNEQWERCAYTSASLFEWLKVLRGIRVGFIIVPILCGGFAGLEILKGASWWPVVVAIAALLAGVVPTLYAALKLDEAIPLASRLAGEYKNLEIAYVDLAAIGPTQSAEDFDKAYRALRERQDAANAHAYTAPDFFFRRAQRKFRKGDYTFGAPEK